MTSAALMRVNMTLCSRKCTTLLESIGYGVRWSLVVSALLTVCFPWQLAFSQEKLLDNRGYSDDPLRAYLEKEIEKQKLCRETAKRCGIQCTDRLCRKNPRRLTRAGCISEIEACGFTRHSEQAWIPPIWWNPSESNLKREDTAHSDTSEIARGNELEDSERAAIANCVFSLPAWLLERANYFPKGNTASFRVDFQRLGCRLLAEGLDYKNIQHTMNIMTYRNAACRGPKINRGFWLLRWPDTWPGGDLSPFAENTAQDYCARDYRRSPHDDYSVLESEMFRFRKEWFCAVHKSIAEYGGLTPGIEEFRTEVDRLCEKVRSGRLSIEDGNHRAKEAFLTYHGRLEEGYAKALFEGLKWFVEQQ